MKYHFLPVLISISLLAGCAGGSGSTAVKRPSAPPPAPRPAVIRPPVHAPPPRALVQTAPGLEGVIGAEREDLIRQFGTPRLDVWEGDARKLQFVGTACVLDVFLYPAAAGRDPQATYVETRRASDGQDVDRAACITALRKR